MRHLNKQLKNLKRLFTLVVVFAMIAVFAGCAAPAPAETAPDDSTAATESSEATAVGQETNNSAPEFVTGSYKINICTATSSGIFYAGGVALAQLFQEKIPGYMASAMSSSGSGENVSLLANQEANIGFVQSDYVLKSYFGLDDFEGAAHDNFRILCPMFANPYNLMIEKGSGINSIEDVKGKRVVTGRSGSGTLSATEALLGSFDITLDDVTPSYLDQAQSVESLRNGLADFALAAGALPMAAVTDAMTGNSNIRLLGLTQEQIDTVLEKNSWMTAMDIPANTYDNQPDALKTVGHYSFLITTADMPDDVAYRLVKAMYDNKDWLVGTLNSFDNICFNSPEDPITAVGVPVHPGAEIALKELGLMN